MSDEERGLTVEEAEELEPGDNVFVRSLVSRPDLNGRMGMVTCGLDNCLNMGTGRVLVQVERELRPIALKPANLDQAPAGCRYFIGPADGKAAKKAAKQAAKAKAASPAAPASDDKAAKKAAKRAAKAAEAAAEAEALAAAQPEEAQATAPKAAKAAKAKAKRAAGGDAPAGKHRRKEAPPPPPAAGVEDEGEEGTRTPEYGSASGHELTVAIREIVRSADLTVLTPKAVREELEVRLELQAGSLKERKQEVSRLIDAALAALRSSESSAPAD